MMVRTPYMQHDAVPAGYEIVQVEFTDHGPETVWVLPGQDEITEQELPF